MNARRDGAAPDTTSILVTVGTELPFDRMIRAIDEWATEAHTGGDIFAQIGHADYRPRSFAFAEFVDSTDFQRLIRQAELIVSHAGMGTILTALQYQKPLLVMPRRAELREHRNDHQLASATRLAELGRIQVAFDEQELVAALEAGTTPSTDYRIGPYADEQLTSALRDAILQGGRRA